MYENAVGTSDYCSNKGKGDGRQMKQYYARHDNSFGQKETVTHHLCRVSELCGTYAATFGCEAEGRAIGMLHDFGKYSDVFQQVLEGKRQNIDQCDSRARFCL